MFLLKTNQLFSGFTLGLDNFNFRNSVILLQDSFFNVISRFLCSPLSPQINSNLKEAESEDEFEVVRDKLNFIDEISIIQQKTNDIFLEDEEIYEDQEEDNIEPSEDNNFFLKFDSSLNDDIVFESDDFTETTVESDCEISQIPPWFSYEDKDQIKIIFEIYEDALGIKNTNNLLIRASPKFIGRIKRCKVKNNNSCFQTLDTVEQFTRALIAPGRIMPHVQTDYFLTTWSYQDGIPTNLKTLSILERKEWEKKLDCIRTPASYLLCKPVFQTISEYDYFVTNQCQEVRHSPRSYSPCCYDEYLPSLKH